MTTVEIKTVACDPECGFSVSSHDETELVGIVKKHAKDQHDMSLSTTDVEGMMKTS